VRFKRNPRNGVWANQTKEGETMNKVLKVPSKISSNMYTWAIQDETGLHYIQRGTDERLYAEGLDLTHYELNAIVKKARANDRKNKSRRDKDQAMRDIGMVKVKGALGGTYWE